MDEREFAKKEMEIIEKLNKAAGRDSIKKMSFQEILEMLNNSEAKNAFMVDENGNVVKSVPIKKILEDLANDVNIADIKLFKMKKDGSSEEVPIDKSTIPITPMSIPTSVDDGDNESKELSMNDIINMAKILECEPDLNDKFESRLDFLDEMHDLLDKYDMNVDDLMMALSIPLLDVISEMQAPDHDGGNIMVRKKVFKKCFDLALKLSDIGIKEMDTDVGMIDLSMMIAMLIASMKRGFQLQKEIEPNGEVFDGMSENDVLDLLRKMMDNIDDK